jgi:hypothetical protein
VGKVTAKLALAPPSDQGFRDLSAGYAVHFSVTDNFREGNEPRFVPNATRREVPTSSQRLEEEVNE